jgi:hypothetical protein
MFCFVSVLCVSFEHDDHRGYQGNTAQALNQWRHPVASSEALDVLHQAERWVPTVVDGCRFGHHFLTAGERFLEITSSCRIKFLTRLIY